MIEVPIRLALGSRSEWAGSSHSKPSASAKTVAASSNGTPCFWKLRIAFWGSQENTYCIYSKSRSGTRHQRSRILSCVQVEG